MESTVTCIEPPEFKSPATHSQPQDGISLKLYPATGTQVSRGTESATNRIQPPELESAAGQNQPQLVSSRRRMESATTRIQPPELELAAG